MASKIKLATNQIGLVIQIKAQRNRVFKLYYIYALRIKKRMKHVNYGNSYYLPLVKLLKKVE